MVDDTFVPNAYIWVVVVDTDNSTIPEYKVWYSEIVVDKTDKKSFVNIVPNKKTYKPREKVTLDLKVKDKWNRWKKSELTVMVVDDSLISLMWNIDMNTLEKFYKKLPFQIQTSITNIAMLKNYYFSRPWIVWWSWFWNFKGWDSAVSSRNIFKNTAYYNPSVISDNYWNAKVSFNLPDNLTNFRVMVLSNSKDNFFWYKEDFIEVRKNVIIEDKTPLIFRDWDISTIWANIFNNTSEDIWFKIELTTKWVQAKDPEKNITIKSWSSQFVSWEISINRDVERLEYKIVALWDSIDNSDKLEWVIDIKSSPVLISNIIKQWTIAEKEAISLDLDIPENTDFDRSKVEVIFSNNKLNWIEKIVLSLAKYPYWCIEQTTSSTLPNAILKKFIKMFSWVFDEDYQNNIDKNLTAWIDRIKSMQTKNWWFAYWQWENEPNLHITPYVLRSLIDMKNYWADISNWLIDRTIEYLEKNKNNKNITDLEKAEIYWALAKAWKDYDFEINTSDRHTLIAYTYWLILNDKNKYSKIIDDNIEKIKDILDNNSTYSRYRNSLSDKAIFTSMLIDYDHDINYIDDLIWELYDYDWSSYYYSTQSKNNAFMAFVKYLDKYWKNRYNKFGFSLWTEFNKNKIFRLWGTKWNIMKNEYTLSDITSWNKIDFKIANLSWDNLYTTIILRQYPKDKTKIKSVSQQMNVKREIFKVLDEKSLSRCSSNNYRWNDNNEVCKNALKLVENDIYDKWELYKVKIVVDLESNKNVKNLVIEDYLPSTFRVINSKFKTESIGVTQATTKKSWNWNHIEFRPEVVMANASYVWQNQAVFEYYFKPEFLWKYTHPPVTSYIMYNPQIRANSSFRFIEVR